MIESSNLQAYSDNKNQSIFKLPIIFAVMMVIGAIFSFTIRHTIFNTDYEIPTSSNWGLFYNSFFLFYVIICNSVYYFIVALIMLIAQKVHRITAKNILALLLICVICTVIDFFIMKWCGGLTPLAIYSQLFYFTGSGLFSFFINIVFVIYEIIKLLILVVLFKLMRAIYQQEPDSYVLPYAAHSNLFSFLFTTILCCPSFLMSFIITNFISILLLNYFNVNSGSGDLSKLFIISIAMVPVIITLTILLLNLILCFFIVKGCFVRKFNRIPLKLFFKSAGRSYLYSVIFCIMISLIRPLIFIIVSPLKNSFNDNQILVMLVIISIILDVIVIVGIIKIIRRSVRKYFS